MPRNPGDNRTGSGPGSGGRDDAGTGPAEPNRPGGDRNTWTMGDDEDDEQ